MKKRMIQRNTVALTLLGGLLLVFIGYNTRDVIIGAPLSVKVVKSGSTVAASYLPIEGNARHAKELHINGRQVSIDTEGNFSDGIVLSPGYNIVTISQKDRFGNEKEKIMKVVATPKSGTGGDVEVYYKNE